MRTVGRVQQRRDGAAQGARELVGGGVVEVGQPQTQPLQLGLDDLVGAGAQRHDDRLDALRRHRGEVGAHLVGDDRAGELDVVLGRGGLGDLGERREVDARDAGERGDRLLGVVRQGQVDDDERARCRRRARRDDSSAVRTRPVDPVQETTRSTSASSSGRARGDGTAADLRRRGAAPLA